MNHGGQNDKRKFNFCKWMIFMAFPYSSESSWICLSLPTLQSQLPCSTFMHCNISQEGCQETIVFNYCTNIAALTIVPFFKTSGLFAPEHTHILHTA